MVCLQRATQMVTLTDSHWGCQMVTPKDYAQRPMVRRLVNLMGFPPMV